MILRRRRAISYIMSVAIMTFVTLAMASVVLVWSLGQTATSQNTFASAINANEAKAEERFTIEQVQFLANGQSGGQYTCLTSNGCLILYIRNVGSIQLVVDAVYVNNQLSLQDQYGITATTIISTQTSTTITSTTTSTSSTTTTTGTTTTVVTLTTATSPVRLSLGIQQLGSIALPAPFPITSGTTYTISASSTRGNVVTVVQTY